MIRHALLAWTSPRRFGNRSGMNLVGFLTRRKSDFVDPEGCGVRFCNSRCSRFFLRFGILDTLLDSLLERAHWDWSGWFRVWSELFCHFLQVEMQVFGG